MHANENGDVCTVLCITKKRNVYSKNVGGTTQGVPSTLKSRGTCQSLSIRDANAFSVDFYVVIRFLRRTPVQFGNRSQLPRFWICHLELNLFVTHSCYLANSVVN